MDAGLAHMVQRLQAIGIDAGRDDLAVEFRRGVEIVVVIIESGLLEPPRLRRGQHAERRAGLQPERLAAPMQNRLAPAVLAARASAITASSAMSLSACRPVS